MRNKTVSTAPVWLLAILLIWCLPVAAAPVQTSLSLDSLRGGMQGQSGIVLDLNGDGYEDLVIGAPYARVKGAVGALLVYRGNRSGFQPNALLTGEDNLGWSLVSLGNVAKDGKGYFAAGAFGGSNSAVSLAGTVAIYKGINPMAGSKPEKLTVLAGENALDKFGYVLAAGDLNGDGIPDLAVGAPFHSPGPALYQKGAVYVFFGPDYNPGTAVKIPATSANGGIGFSLAAGDLNGDGVDDLLVQASGKVNVYYGVKGSFAPNPDLPDVVFKSSDAGFGKSMAVLPDLNGDGLKDFAVGADQATIGGVPSSGRLFILAGGVGQRSVNADAASPDLLAKIDGEPNEGRFGSAVLPVINAEGGTDLAVSAVHAEGNPWWTTGKIYLFNGKSLTSGASVATANAFPGDGRDMNLGAFLAQSVQRKSLVAGAPTVNANTGGVWLFDLR